MPIHTATQPRVAKSRVRRYRLAVAANSATGFGDPISKRRTGAPISIAGAFFCARISCLWWLCVGDLRVCRVPFAPVRQPAHSCHPKSFGDDPWQLQRRKRSTTYVHPNSARNPCTRSPSYGLERPPRKFIPFCTSQALQRTHEHCSSPGRPGVCNEQATNQQL